MLRIIFIVLSTLLAGFLIRPTNDAVLTSGHAYPEQLPGAFTGGFGEDTCNSCHFDYPLNPEEGKLAVEGIPLSYKEGQSYTFTIKLSRKNLGKAGFQLSARHADSTQAGTFELNSDRTKLTQTNNSLQYVQHSRAGTKPNSGDTIRWHVQWRAPSQGSGKVFFNLAANAANGDASEFGDFIFVRKFLATLNP